MNHFFLFSYINYLISHLPRKTSILFLFKFLVWEKKNLKIIAHCTRDLLKLCRTFDDKKCGCVIEKLSLFLFMLKQTTDRLSQALPATNKR